jgi:hypothetical protein
VARVRCLNLGLGFDVSFRELHYMHANPVLRGLVKHPKDWPWSSWSFYEKGEVGLGCCCFNFCLSCLAFMEGPAIADTDFNTHEENQHADQSAVACRCAN